MKRLILLIGSLLATPLAAQTTIETISFWDGSSAVFPFGKPETPTYGQSFTAPVGDNVLQSFSFFLRDIGAGDQLLFQGYVSAWDVATNRLTGPLLYTSGIRNGPPAGGGFTRYDFATGGTTLVGGQAYIAFLSVSGHFGDIPVSDAATDWGYLAVDGYDGGRFWFQNSLDDLSLLATNGWSTLGAADLAFELQFDQGGPTVIPEPATVILLGTGMGILLLGVRRRKKS